MLKHLFRCGRALAGSILAEVRNEMQQAFVQFDAAGGNVSRMVAADIRLYFAPVTGVVRALRRSC